MLHSRGTRMINTVEKIASLWRWRPKTTVNQRKPGKLQYVSMSKPPKVNSSKVFRNTLIGERRRCVCGGRILHLPQYVSSLIKDEQLCALGDAVFFFSVP